MVFEAVRNFGRQNSADGQRGASAGFLRPIATEKLAGALQLESKAAENGKSNLPATQSDVLDVVEQSIIQRIESEWIWQGGELVNQLRAYASRLSETSIASEFNQLQLKADDALTSLRAAHLRAEAQLAPLKARFGAARSELESFRDKHGLIRPVMSNTYPWTTFGFTFVLVAGESILNGFFFAKGSDFGFAGGIGTLLAYRSAILRWPLH